MKKRLREIDLEAPGREEDDDAEDDASVPAWDSFSKKARWMRDLRAGKWPLDPTSPNTEPHSGSRDVQADERGTPMPSAGFDLQTPVISSDFPESRPRAEQNPNEFENSENISEFERKSTGKDGPEKSELAKEAERSVRGTERKRIFASPPAVLLYSFSDRQDVELHSFLENQGSLVSQADLSIRLEAISCIGQRVELIKESGTRKLVTELIQQQLWKEEEPCVIQALVKVLCSAALVSCADDPKDNKDLDWTPSQVVARVLLQYITTRDVKIVPLKSTVKVQLLRSLYLVGKDGGSLELDSLGPLAKEQLGSSNPRLREWGIRLLVQSIKERNAVASRDPGKIRAGVAKHLQRSRAEGESLMHALLEYTRDPYPNVREAVVWGILNLHSKGFALKHSTYGLAVTLLRDSFEAVRICAIKLVGICSKAAAWDILEGAQFKYVDNAFLQICNMMTDMITSVRQEACNILAEMTGVSDVVLLQSLTKKILATSVTEKESTAGGSTSIRVGDLDVANIEENRLFDWSAAGAFVVGLEDEFWEVRSAAVKALAKLGLSSEKMAHGALELMVDMINDDSSHVRQQTILALANLALAGRLSVLEAHLHMSGFEGAGENILPIFPSGFSLMRMGILEDPNMEMRNYGHELLSVITLPSIATFQLTIRAILTSLEKHPEDEKSSLATLEKLGKSHASHTECIASELVKELRGLLNGESGLDDPRCIAVLVLLLGAAMSNEKIISFIPSQIISMASIVSNKLPVTLPLLRVLPMGFKTVQYAWATKDGALFSEKHSNDQRRDSHRNWWSVDGAKHIPEYVNLESQGQDSIWEGNFKRDGLNYESKSSIMTGTEETEGSGKPLVVAKWQQRGTLYQCGEQEILRFAGQIVASALGTSLLLGIKAFKEVLQRLSGCRKELKALKGRCMGLSGTVSFCGLYLQCLILVVQLRANFVSQESRLVVKKSGLPQDLLDKLHIVVKHLLHRFWGFRYEQLLQILEFHALVFVWKLALCPVDKLVNDGPTSVHFLELGSAVGMAEKIMKSEDLPCSLLLKSVQEQLLNEEGKASVLNMWRTARQLALSYWPGQMAVDPFVKEMWAEMKAPGSDFDHPVGFIAGLPLGIPIDVTVYNVPDMYSLWVQFVRDTCTAGYKLLDVEESGTSLPGHTRRLSTLLQLDEMPQVASSVCRICIVLEGVDRQGVHAEVETERGPKGSILPLCVEMEVHLFLIRERGSKQPPHGKR